MRARVLLLAVLAGCATSTASYVQGRKGYRVVSGYVKRVDGLDNPKIRKLKDGTVYTVTTEGCTVVMYSGQKDLRTRTYDYQEFTLQPGDEFVNSRPVSFVLIREGREPSAEEPAPPR